MKVMVTGATGFIGLSLARFLLSQGHSVVAMVRETSRTDALREAGIKTVTADLGDPSSLQRAMTPVDVLFHLAAARGEWGWTKEQYRRTNVDATVNLVRAARGRARRFIYCSSVSVYGHIRRKPADEDYPLAPVNDYGRTKVEAERRVRELGREAGVPFTVIRPVITYGPGDTHGMVTKLIGLVAARRYLTVGNGRNHVHLVYIDDLLHGLDLTMRTRSSEGETFIIAGARPIRVGDLAAKAAALVGRHVPPVKIPAGAAKLAGLGLEVLYKSIPALRQREPMVTRSKVDIMAVDRSYSIAKARRVLGYSPSVDYEEGLGRTIQWWRGTKGLPSED